MNSLGSHSVLGAAIVLAAFAVESSAQNSSRDSVELAKLKAEAVRSAVDRVRGAVVQVRAIGEFRSIGRHASGASTGLLLDREWVITSSFGLENRPKVLLTVLPSGETRSASLVSIDSGRKMALVRIAEPVTEDPARLEPRSGAAPGETAIALGAAYSSSEPIVSVGVVSATGRFFGRAVQTDAAASPANYGGPLIDLQGRVLGMITPLGQESGQLGAQLYDSGIGFAISLEDILARLPRMQKGEDLTHGRTGLAFTKGNPFVDEPSVTKIAPESPAAVAGMKKRDLVTKVGRAPVATQKQFQIALGPFDAGDTVELEVLRGEEPLQFELELVAAAELKQPEKELPSLLKRLKLDLPKID